MKYFSLQKTYDQNRKIYLLLSNQHHPDKPTGNTEKMQDINKEWEEVEKQLHEKEEEITVGQVFWENIFDEEEEEQEDGKFVIFNSIKYDLNDEKILEKIALRFGGLGLMEFTSSKEWQEHINE